MFNCLARDILSLLMKRPEHKTYLFLLRALVVVSLLAGLCAHIDSTAFEMSAQAKSPAEDQPDLVECPSLAGSDVACLEGRTPHQSEPKRLRLRLVTHASTNPLELSLIGRRRSHVTHPQSYYPWSYISQISDRAPPLSV
ncbi:MAG: hypothetical protein L0229_07125 [Blastocatellia bacterium]|nr:hypothetical protein [Blastocatellia bacterium]